MVVPALKTLFKKKYRIVPHSANAGQNYYIVEKKFLFFWGYITLTSSIPEAESVIKHLMQEPKIYGEKK